MIMNNSLSYLTRTSSVKNTPIPMPTFKGANGMRFHERKRIVGNIIIVIATMTACDHALKIKELI